MLFIRIVIFILIFYFISYFFFNLVIYSGQGVDVCSED